MKTRTAATKERKRRLRIAAGLVTIGRLLGALFIPGIATGQTGMFATAEQAIVGLETGVADLGARVSTLESSAPADYSSEISDIAARVTALEADVADIQATLTALGDVLNPQ